MRSLRRACVLAVSALLFPGAQARAQVGLPRPHLDWRTIESAHFIVHYPREMHEWTVDVASRLEAVHVAVSRLVGSAPTARISVIVEDPLNVSNGSAWPMLGAPAIYLWPVAPEPQSQIGNTRGWGEILAVHEYAHIAQLTWPSRNRRERLLWRILPVNIGPLARRSPRWVIEGYATYVEGKLTGSGRPHGIARAAALRQFALEGRLPTYAQLNAWNTYLGGSMAYLVGSAYLEWLVQRKGEVSLEHLWRRMSARQRRNFAQAFTGVYGGTPDELYGRFVAEMTGRALDAEAALGAAGMQVGDTVQRLAWGTGEPALSPDGKHLALVLRYRDLPSRLVLWRTDSQPEDSSVRKARERMMRRDPQDVPAIEFAPRPKKAVAVLHPRGGRSHEAPRFMPNGKELLVSRPEPLGDGAYRADLFLWSYQTGSLRRVTRGAAIRAADPHPSGDRAVGVRCLVGRCDLVRVNLRDGRVTVLAAGSPGRTYHRPRYSPDGTRIAVGVQEAGRWRVGLLDDAPAGGAPRFVGPDDGISRYAPAFVSADTLVIVSERGGIANLETLAWRTGAIKALTRVAGAALAPEPDRGRRVVYFLALHGKGLDVNRVALSNPPPGGTLTLDAALAPVAAIPRVPADSFRAAALSAPKAYGVGPREYRLLPGIGGGAEGVFGTVALASTDKVGRLTWLAQGSYGTRGTWRGGMLGASWRGTRPSVHGSAFLVQHAPSRQWGRELTPALLDIRYAAGAIGGTLWQDAGNGQHLISVGLSSGRVEFAETEKTTRSFAQLTADVSRRQRRALWFAAESLCVHLAAGRTGQDWRRGVVELELRAGRGPLGIAAGGVYGEVGRDAPAFEQLTIGGLRPPLTERGILSQRREAPALPFGVASGRRLVGYRVAMLSEGLQPFYADLRAGESLAERHRVIGLERAAGASGVAIVGIPGIQIAGGVAYSLDEPFRNKVRVYGTVIYRP